MSRFETALCWTLVAATVLVLLYGLRPASRSGSQVAPSSAPPVRPSSDRLLASPTGTPEGSYPGIGPSGQPDLEVSATAVSGVPSPHPRTSAVPRTTERESRGVPLAAAGPVPGARVTAASGHRVTGLASWYCRPPTSRCTRGYPASGLYAAAGATLRVGNWRGRYVYVNGLRVRLVDSCACGSRVIDLYASAFRRLAPLSAGVVKVSVTW